MSVPGDNPISGPSADLLDRDKVAAQFVDQVLSLDRTQGLVVGVTGAWGSGKTSFLSLARPRLEESGAVLLGFNPWMFSGAQQLVDAFFVELASQLKSRKGMAEIGQLIEDYGEIFSGLSWIPVVGPWIDRGRGASKILGRLLQRRKEGITKRAARLRQALSESEKPIAVILDDIDRLSTAEIRDIFKLVRLTASFPNVVYVLAFDRERVEAALEEQNVPGRDYLEKILQLSLDLPFIPRQVLLTQLTFALDAALKQVEWVDDEDEAAWPDVLAEVIFPHIRHMRDVRRYVAAVHGAVVALSGRVALTDLMALEAVRVFMPEVFSKLHASAQSLTAVSSYYGTESIDASVGALVTAGGEKSKAVKDLIDRIFPAASRHIGGTSYGSDWLPRWLRSRRVAHRDILLLYLERVAGASLTAHDRAEIAWGLMHDQDAFDGFLRQIEPQQLQDVIAALETFESDFRLEHVAPATIVLLNLVPEIQERTRGMFEVGKSQIVRRVVLRLLKSISDEAEVERAVEQVLPELDSLSAQWSVISVVGHREREGHQLVSAAAAELYEWAWRRQVVAAEPQVLAGEEDLLHILATTSGGAEADGAPFFVPDDPVLTRALVRSARTEIRTQNSNSRVVARIPVLMWDLLVRLVGDEASLIERAAGALQGGEDPELLELVRKYAGGWRPPERYQ